MNVRRRMHERPDVRGWGLVAKRVPCARVQFTMSNLAANRGKEACPPPTPRILRASARPHAFSAPDREYWSLFCCANCEFGLRQSLLGV